MSINGLKLCINTHNSILQLKRKKNFKLKLRALSIYLMFIGLSLFFIASLLIPKSHNTIQEYNLSIICDMIIAIGVYLILIGGIILIKSLKRKIRRKF
ncbi:MAG: hypothetical protein ACTSPY_16945 [Candidatus Helarchaeota archaeon]